MPISARNQFRGTVVSLKHGAVMSEVILDIGGGHRIVSLMSSEAAAELGLEPGARAVASVKSTNVVVERP